MPTGPTIDKAPPQDVILMNSDDDSNSHTMLNSQSPLSEARISKGSRSAEHEELTLQESSSNDEQSLNDTPKKKWNLKFEIWNLEFWNLEFWNLSVGFRSLEFEFKILN